MGLSQTHKVVSLLGVYVILTYYESREKRELQIDKKDVYLIEGKNAIPVLLLTSSKLKSTLNSNANEIEFENFCTKNKLNETQ